MTTRHVSYSRHLPKLFTDTPDDSFKFHAGSGQQNAVHPSGAGAARDASRICQAIPAIVTPHGEAAPMESDIIVASNSAQYINVSSTGNTQVGG